MSELASKMKLNVNSIYHEFGNKNKLFMACIDNFLSNYCQVEEILSKEPLGLNNIEAFFQYKMNIYNSEYGKGCLVFNSVMENESLSKEANSKVATFLSKMKTLYRNCLAAAQKKKEIPKNANVNSLADFMCNFTYGFVNLGMKTMKKKDLKDSIDIVLKTIKS